MTYLTHKKLLCIIIASALAACDVPSMQDNAQRTQGAVAQTFVDAEPDQLAQGLADAINDDLGNNLGGGAAFRRATATGENLEIQIQLNLAANGVGNREKRRASSSVRRGFGFGLCEDGPYRSLLASGGSIKIALYGRDNGFIDSFVYDRPCS